MIEHLIKLTCDNCGHSITYSPEDTETVYGWTDKSCPKCQRFKPVRNLDPYTIRLNILRFANDLKGREV